MTRGYSRDVGGIDQNLIQGLRNKLHHQAPLAWVTGLNCRVVLAQAKTLHYMGAPQQ